MKRIETERLVLRSWLQSDLEDFYDYAKDPDVGPMAGWEPHTSIETSRNILASFIQSGQVWAIEEKASGRVIGSLGLHLDEKRRPVNTRMLGYVIGKNYWGKGYTPEAVKAVIHYAFEDLNLDLMSVYHYPHNVQSRSVILKCGFTYEGTLRLASQIFNDHIYDDVCYSMTRTEYEEAFKNKG